MPSATLSEYQPHGDAEYFRETRGAGGSGTDRSLVRCVSPVLPADAGSGAGAGVSSRTIGAGSVGDFPGNAPAWNGGGLHPTVSQFFVGQRAADFYLERFVCRSGGAAQRRGADAAPSGGGIRA